MLVPSSVAPFPSIVSSCLPVKLPVLCSIMTLTERLMTMRRIEGLLLAFAIAPRNEPGPSSFEVDDDLDGGGLARPRIPGFLPIDHQENQSRSVAFQYSSGVGLADYGIGGSVTFFRPSMIRRSSRAVRGTLPLPHISRV